MGRRTTARAWRAPALETMLFGGLALWLGLLVFATPFNHDEDQYLAASVLAAKALLYRDFLYVQTPLQPELTAWLTGLAPGWSFLVLRLASAAFGLAALAGVWSAQRRLDVGRRAASAATLLMASAYTFQYCASVVRNDALPMALLAWAIVAAASALREGGRRPWLGWGVCGLLLGAAVSAKISFAPLLAAAALSVCLPRAALRPRGTEVGSFGLGALAGLAPIALAWTRAPEAVRFALVGFWADGPRRWYVANGLEHRMEPASKLLYGLGDLLLGPALAALALVLLARLRPPRPAGAPAARLLDLMILAGLVAAFAPSPTYKQYFAPLLPPLFIRLGLIASQSRLPAWGRAALGLGAVTGLAIFAMRAGEAALTGRWTPIVVAQENRWIGDTLRQARASGAVATLSAHAVLDSGYPLDRRFAGGAMVYRSADGVPEALRSRLHITSPVSLAADLDAASPAAIVTGYEDGGGDTRVRLDAPLRAYAQSRGYVLHRSPVAAAALYIRPQGASPVVR
ncbi:glycosyltransferase family 39 protein [Caulobacter sp. S45]|uniref:glycosyltransferase family 39 protein n=1 Tax=Caulobacter sp. S45 TaxID=1641861 RepID=UPI0015770D35|nr:glycosyltransferase family 39 protein [Caulobacter sp. S45]